MRIQIQAGTLERGDLVTRMPFRYGIATMTRMPQVFLRLTCSVEGRTSTGTAADLLPPKWFTKVPDQDPQSEIDAMVGVITHALQTAVGRRADSVFSLWRELESLQDHWAAKEGIPGLLAHFGTSLVERALIDAYCRITGQPFAEWLATAPEIDLGSVHPELRGRHAGKLLPKPVRSVCARHTVGLGDPLTAADISAGERLTDGLPQSLEECIQRYGLRHFKIKVSGQLEADLERLRRIASVLQAHAGTEYAFSLDGNEQFLTVNAFRTFWEAVQRDPGLDSFRPHLLFVEQPLHRGAALAAEVRRGFADWPDRPPCIIDESDASLSSLPLALELGYTGTSHKNCKGVFKGVINRCLLQHRARLHPGRPWLMSGEDLCNQGPIALLQDLAVAGALGIQSVERNGHHYVAGLSAYPAEVQDAVLALHPDLYHRTPAGWASLTIRDGHISLGTVQEAPFGTAFTLPPGLFPTIASC